MASSPQERACDGCSQCCKLLGVKEISKPANKWCSMCKIGEGCAAYESRPPSCQDFSCLWLQGLMPEELRPDKVGAVASLTADGVHPVLYVETHRPDAWREGALGEWFKAMVNSLRRGVVVCGPQRHGVGDWHGAVLQEKFLKEVH